MGVPLTGEIERKNPADTYPLARSTVIKGGHWEVADTTARNAIPASCRTKGMMVITKNDLKSWVLLLDSSWAMDDTDWAEVTAGDKTRFLNILGAGLDYASPMIPGMYVPPATPPTDLVAMQIPYLAASHTVDTFCDFDIGSFYPNYGGSAITLDIDWMSTLTSGQVDWMAAFAAWDIATDLSAKVFAAARHVVTTTAATALTPVRSSITFTQAQADAVAAGKCAKIIIGRDFGHGSPDLAGEARITRVRLSWA